MTPAQAKRLVADRMKELGLPEFKLTAKTVSFSGFGYGSTLFVTVHDWKPDPIVDELKKIGRNNGFIVEFTGNFVQGG